MSVPKCSILAVLMMALPLSLLVASSMSQEKSETDWAAQLPDGEGKDLVVKLCSSCHTLERVANQRKTAEQWTGTVDEMISRGAQILPDESDAIAGYLGKALGPNNTAK